jgi:glucose-1-phosphate adenylyltransferase
MRISVVTFILGGGIGRRLYPLTRNRAKPAMPFGGSYRVIDFVLSNFIHSRINKIYVLTQYEPRSLEQHILEGWTPLVGNSKYNMIRLLPAKEGTGSGWYYGTANAIDQNKRYAIDCNPDIVDIFGGDHIYLMDISQMNDYHLSRGADLTISALPINKKLSSRKYGVLVVNKDFRLTGFEEKPIDPTPIPGNRDSCLASMGNYAFNLEVLLDELAIDRKKEGTRDRELISRDPEKYSSHDFGFDIIPSMLRRKKKIFVYDFSQNTIVGSAHNEKAYWRDIGDLDEYYRANMDLVGENPPLDLYNSRWEIFTKADSLQPAKYVSDAKISNSIIANGCIINNASIDNSILSYNVKVHKNVTISRSIILGNNEIDSGAVIKNTIIDRDVCIPGNIAIGMDRKLDKERRFTLSKEGITIVPREYRF